MPAMVLHILCCCTLYVPCRVEILTSDATYIFVAEVAMERAFIIGLSIVLLLSPSRHLI